MRSRSLDLLNRVISREYALVRSDARTCEANISERDASRAGEDVRQYMEVVVLLVSSFPNLNKFSITGRIDRGKDEGGRSYPLPYDGTELLHHLRRLPHLRHLRMPDYCCMQRTKPISASTDTESSAIPDDPKPLPNYP